MKYLVKFFVVTFFIFICTHVFAEQQIAYINMKIILNESKAGKGAQNYLKKTFTDNQKKYTEQESSLKKEESDLIAKKTILSKEEYEKEAEKLRKKVNIYQQERRKSLETLARQRTEARQKLLKALDPILKNYINENNIAMVMDQKNIIAGKDSYDITQNIIKKLNIELPSLSLK